MIRAMPPGFIYPITRGWTADTGGLYWAGPGEEDREKQVWRGFCLVTRVLSQKVHRVTEFAIEGRPLYTGLSVRVFDQRNAEYDAFVKLLSQPGFSILELNLYLGNHGGEDWDTFPSCLLRQALAKVVGLRHFTLCTSLTAEMGGIEPRPLILEDSLPVHSWRCLEHFRHLSPDCGFGECCRRYLWIERPSPSRAQFSGFQRRDG